MLYKIGLIIFWLGAMMGDSDNLFIPVVVIAIGAAMVYFGKEGQDDA